jgi:hypothetical protein
MIERLLRIPMLGTMTAIALALAWFLRPVDRSELFLVSDAQGRMGYVDASGRIAIPPRDRHERESFNEFGLALDRNHEGPSAHMEVLDRHGRIVARADEMHAFAKCGLAWARTGDEHYFIDRTGAVAFEVHGDELKEFGDSGLCAVRLKDKIGYIDGAGKFAIAPEWDSARFSVDDVAGPFPVMRNDLWGFVDRTGKLVVPLEWDEANPFTDTDLSIVRKNGKYGCLDRSGRVALAAEWDNVQPLDSRKMIAVRRDGKWGAVDRAGKLAIPFEWDEIMPFDTSGLALARKGDKWGFLDEEGAIAILIEWDAAESFGRSDLAPVCRKEKWGYIDRSGRLAIPLEWREAQPFRKTGLARVSDVDLRVAFIDRTGKTIIPMRRGHELLDEVTGVDGRLIHLLNNRPEEDPRPDWLQRTLAYLDHGDAKPDRHVVSELFDERGRLVYSSDWLSERAWIILAAIGVGLVGIVEIAWLCSKREASPAA